MAAHKPGSVDSFREVLADVLAATGWRLNVLADRFKVSTKTIGRYYHGKAIPPVGRRHGIVYALSDIDPVLLDRVIGTLGVTGDFTNGMPRAPLPPELARTTLESALGELVERLDTGAQKTRVAITRFVARLDDAHLDVATVRALLAKR
jgi:hypothetical protein